MAIQHLFIGKIPYIITANEAKKLFAGCGKIVAIKIEKDRMELIALVEHSSEEKAKKSFNILRYKEVPKPPMMRIKWVLGHIK
jgi:RNA recognition motif-containing protein